MHTYINLSTLNYFDQQMIWVIDFPTVGDMAESVYERDGFRITDGIALEDS